MDFTLVLAPDFVSIRVALDTDAVFLAERIASIAPLAVNVIR